MIVAIASKTHNKFKVLGIPRGQGGKNSDEAGCRM